MSMFSRIRLAAQRDVPRVLLVAGSTAAAELLSQAFNVTQVADAAGARQLAGTGSYVAAFVDLSSPGTGFVLDILRGTVATVAMVPSDGDGVRAILRGAGEYITSTAKAGDLPALVARVRKELPNRSSAAIAESARCRAIKILDDVNRTIDRDWRRPEHA